MSVLAERLISNIKHCRNSFHGASPTNNSQLSYFSPVFDSRVKYSKKHDVLVSISRIHWNFFVQLAPQLHNNHRKLDADDKNKAKPELLIYTFIHLCCIITTTEGIPFFFVYYLTCQCRQPITFSYSSSIRPDQATPRLVQTNCSNQTCLLERA